MIHTSREELRRSRNRQEQAAKDLKDDMARRMLLFYAVECGAKYQYMVGNNYRMYSENEIPEKYRNNKHDIQKLLKELGLESKCSFPNLQSKHGQTIEPGQYQEVWRYGVNFKNADAKGMEIEEKMQKALELLHDMERRR